MKEVSTMNISAEHVVKNMEEQLNLLKQAIKQQDQQAIREYTSVIEGYCRLLKVSPTHVPTASLPTNSEKPTVPTTSTPIVQEEKEKPGSLFDF